MVTEGGDALVEHFSGHRFVCRPQKLIAAGFSLLSSSTVGYDFSTISFQSARVRLARTYPQRRPRWNQCLWDICLRKLWRRESRFSFLHLSLVPKTADTAVKNRTLDHMHQTNASSSPPCYLRMRSFILSIIINWTEHWQLFRSPGKNTQTCGAE